MADYSPRQDWIIMDWIRAFFAIHLPYDVAKDFQPIVAALIALLAARFAYRAAMARVRFDERLQDGKRLGLYLRLKSQVSELLYRARKIAETLKPLVEDAARRRELEVGWDSAYDIDAHRFDEVVEAWKQIDQFPTDCVRLIDRIRFHLARLDKTADEYRDEAPGEHFPSTTYRIDAEAIDIVCRALLGELDKAIKGIQSLK
jgi:hypothetical protein